MYCSRPVARSPSVVRVVRPGLKCPARQASFLSQPFFQRSLAPAVAQSNDFAPFFRLFDDFAAVTTPHFRHQATGFQPRFDVREVNDSFELRGELPGIDSKDLEVEFSDQQTLVIRGKTEKETSSGTPPQAVETAPAETEATATNAVTEGDDAASTYSTGSYQKPSVEDEESAAPQDTPAESTVADAPAATTQAVAEKPQEPQSRYWVSERVSGSFQRVFKFPTKVDTEAVKASLKNGILNIVVPKAAAPETKRINVE